MALSHSFIQKSCGMLILPLAQTHCFEFVFHTFFFLCKLDYLPCWINSLTQHEDNWCCTVWSQEKVFNWRNWTDCEFRSDFLFQVHCQRFSNLFGFENLDQQKFLKVWEPLTEVDRHGAKVLLVGFKTVNVSFPFLSVVFNFLAEVIERTVVMSAVTLWLTLSLRHGYARFYGLRWRYSWEVRLRSWFNHWVMLWLFPHTQVIAFDLVWFSEIQFDSIFMRPFWWGAFIIDKF